MEDWELIEDMDVLQGISEENVVASLVVSDLVEGDHRSFIVNRTYINKENNHKIASFVSISDPDWEEEFDLTEIEQDNDCMFPVEVGGLFQIFLNPEEQNISIADTLYNTSLKERFENIYDYIGFYVALDSYKQTEEDIDGLTAGMIQGAYCLCQICSEMEFEKSPMAENGKTEMKNLVDNNIKDIKKVMFREKHESTFFYDLTIKTIDCLENVDNYYSGEKEKFVDSSNVKIDDNKKEKADERGFN